MLYIALFIVIILLIAERIINNRNTKEIKTINVDSFYKKEYLLTQTELKIYKLLKQITDKMNLTLFCQVPMYELVNCNNFKDFAKIKSKSIDFVITEKNCKIKLCIELDDYTHSKNKRIERDNFVNKVFDKIGTKLVRIKVQNYYSIEELEEIIRDNI